MSISNYLTTRSTYGSGTSTFSSYAGVVGDYVLVSVKISSASISVSSISGTPWGTWTRLFQYVDTARGGTYEIWGAPVTVAHATVLQTATVTWSSAIGTTGTEFFAQEFSWTGGGAGVVWRVAASGQNIVTGSSGTVTWPGLTSAASGDQLYFGACRVGNTAAAGSTSGFTYSTVDGNGDLALYNVSLAGSTTYTPACTQSPAGAYSTWGIILMPLFPPRVPQASPQAVMRAAIF